MADQNNVNALKRLCAKVIGGAAIAADIEGNTIADVIDKITENLSGNTDPELGSLTIASVAGSTSGTTKITVTGGNDALKYKYKVSSSTITAPERDEDLSDWTDWDGVSDIAADDSANIYIAQVDDNSLALKGGSTTVTAKM